MISLEGKVALVTGASGGIGAAVARSLDADGVRLALASRSGDDLGIADAVAGPCDVRDPAALEDLAAGPWTASVGSTSWWPMPGSAPTGPFLDLDPDHLEEMIDINVKGTMYAVRAALPYLVQSGEADIVTLASEAGRRGPSLRGGLLRLQIRPGRVAPRPSITSCGSRECAAPTCAPGGGDRLRHGPRPDSRHAATGGDDDRRRGGGGRALRPHPPPDPPHPRGGAEAGDGDLLGLRLVLVDGPDSLVDHVLQQFLAPRHRARFDALS